MNGLVELIKRIGIFMIAAQAVLHFAPGQKYEKYIKLIIGTLILLQFVAPLNGILAETGNGWDDRLSEMEAMFAESLTGELDNAPTAADAVTESLENEIKSRLNDDISGEGYQVSHVKVLMQSCGEGGNRQYELEKVRIVVYCDAPGSHTGDTAAGEEAVIGVEKVQIDKVEISAGGREGNGNLSGGSGEEAAVPEDGKGESRLFQEEGEPTGRLRTRFARVLGLEEEIVEVSVYGAGENN